MRFTVRALAILADLLTMPAAAVGIESASPGRNFCLSHEVQMPLPKDMAINLGRECRAIVQLGIAEVVCSVITNSTEKLMRADSHNGTTSPCEASGG